MTKERELLSRAFVYLSGLPARSYIQDDIEAYLSAEPEANCYGDGNVYRGVRSKDSEVKTVYVKTAEPARKPMTREEIDEEIATNEHYCERSFAEGVRFAEKYHGIGGDDDKQG